MATNYFRITAYHPTEDLSVIMDTNGLYEKLWQFSSYLLSIGFQVLEVSNSDIFLDGNISKVEPDKNRLILRSHHKGKPENITYTIGSVIYKAIKVGDKSYIPDRAKTGGTV